VTFEEWADRAGAASGKMAECRQAWDAATTEAKKRAAEVAREQRKRYTCRKMRGVCDAIADTIERADSE
jgi:ribosomal protein S5